MKNSFTFFLFALLSILFFSQMSCVSSNNKKANQNQSASSIQLEHHEKDARIDVKIDGQLFTSYMYHDSGEKPILYPILSASNQELTRGFPYNPKPYERTDHLHHAGHWLNYGDVNGLDFWNNSQRVSPEKKHRYGKIKHQKIVNMKEENGAANLQVEMLWKDHEETNLLTEQTNFRFSVQNGVRIIDRTTTLKAIDQVVTFNDNKEGFVAIRVARQMEFPEKKALKLVGEDGKPMAEAIVNNDGVSGRYLSSEGIEGKNVWGTRASWMRLSGVFGDKTASFVIIDHPENVGYPTYWHARTYGLFAANPLGQKVFSKGKEVLNFALQAGESVTFKYRILVAEGSSPITAEEIEQLIDH